MTVRFVQEAQQEFLDAIRYYEEAEPGLGRRFSVEAVDSQMDPSHGQPFDSLTVQNPLP